MRHPITLNRANLRAALTIANRATPGIRSGQLAGILTAWSETATAPEGATLTATDGIRTVTVELAVAAGSIPAGTGTVSIRFGTAALAAALKGKGARTVRIAPDADTLPAESGPEGAPFYRGAVFDTGAATVTLPDGPDGPELADPAYDTITTGAVSLATLAPVAAVASRDAARPILTGVSLRTRPDGRMEAAGTDSYRLAARTLAGPELAAPVLVPAAVIMEGARHSDTGTLTILAGDRYRLTSGPVTQWGALIYGDFPNYHQLAPAVDTLRTWQVNRAELAAVAGTAAAVKGDAPLVVECGPDALTITGPGGLAARIPATGPEGAESHRFGVSPAFLGDALAAGDASGETVALHVDTPLRPFYVDTAPDAGPELAAPGRSLVMPVRLS
jgi:hypothetical protein